MRGTPVKCLSAQTMSDQISNSITGCLDITCPEGKVPERHLEKYDDGGFYFHWGCVDA